jgi:hypothetical protein
MHGDLEPQREETFPDRLSRVATEPLDYPSLGASGARKASQEAAQRLGLKAQAKPFDLLLDDLA